MRKIFLLALLPLGACSGLNGPMCDTQPWQRACGQVDSPVAASTPVAAPVAPAPPAPEPEPKPDHHPHGWGHHREDH